MAESDSLDGLTAVVTGASSGIGAATAVRLASDGANVVLAARRADRLEELADALSDHDVETLVVPTNVRDEGAVEVLVERTVERFGGIDVLVNNAGVARGSDVAVLDTDDYRAMQETNVDGVFYATRAALPHLVESEGNLVFVGSFAGQYPRPFNPVYAATKWWTRGFALSVAGQVGDDGVGVTVVNPAAVRTEFTIDGLVDETFEDRYDPGEAVEPGEVADAIAFAVHTDPSTVTELDLYDRGKLTMF